jgi:hypothetical protein
MVLKGLLENAFGLRRIRWKSALAVVIDWSRAVAQPSRLRVQAASRRPSLPLSIPGSGTLPEPAGEDACLTGAADASAQSTESREDENWFPAVFGGLRGSV